jgi:hypothetical protein
MNEALSFALILFLVYLLQCFANPFLPHVGALHTDRVPFAVRFNSEGALIGLESRKTRLPPDGQHKTGWSIHLISRVFPE